MLTETTTTTWCEVTESSVALHRLGIGGTRSDVEVGDRYLPTPSCLPGDRLVEVRETTAASVVTWAGVALAVVLLAAAVFAVVVGAVSVARRVRGEGGQRRRRKKKQGLIDERFTSRQ